ncbi:YitT family protein [Salimicrobium sp. PL1-032A]|uniref:YczE/YyaS/YitT family protein n=1 Tax=Salimicrobium sp. PL1-032A TaxID=3095364 RepID=UPI00325FE9E9
MRRIYQRAGYYFSGLLILTLGIALTVLGGLGTSPFDALLVGLYRTFGLTIGSWEIVVGISMIIFNAVAEKRRPEMIAIVTSLITGLGIDFWVFTLEGWVTPAAVWEESIVFFLGMVISALGISINLQANFAPIPFDRMMLVIRNLTGWNVTISRAAISVVLVLLALFFNGAVGIGTLIIMVVSGAFIQYFMGWVQRFDHSIVAPEKTFR